jgi:hypothetical protein
VLNPSPTLNQHLTTFEVDGDLEYLIPSELDQTQHLLRFSHLVIDGFINDYVPQGDIPHAEGDKPRVACSPKALESLMKEDASQPLCLEWLIQHELPQLGLRILSFHDATLISLTCLHSLVDAVGMGMDGIIGAWMLVLQGRKSELPPLCGVDEDLLTNLGKHPPIEPYKLADRIMSRAETLCWALKRIFHTWLSHRPEERVIFVPATWLQRLRDAVLRDLAMETAKKGKESKTTPFVSEGDVLVAWWTRYAIQHLRKKTNKTLLITNAYNIRPVLSGRLLPTNHFYPSNALTFLFVLSSMGEVLSKPINWLAKNVRQSITEMGTFEQTEAMAHTFLQEKKSFTDSRMLGDMGMHSVAFSNWSKAKFFELDLSEAVSKSRVAQSTEKLSRVHHDRVLPSYFCGLVRQSNRPLSNFCYILGKDSKGNYWLNASLPPEAWAAIVEDLEKQPGLDKS